MGYQKRRVANVHRVQECMSIACAAALKLSMYSITPVTTAGKEHLPYILQT